MINRRHIRVKVMQSLYAMQQNQNEDLVREEKFLKHSILKMYDLYVLNFLLIIELQKLAAKKIELSKKKILATTQDLQPNTTFIDNAVINKISESISLESFLAMHKIDNWELDDEYVKIIFDELQKSDFYKEYLEQETNFNNDKEFVITLFKEIIAPNEKLAEYYEDKMISWVDDIPFVNTWVLKTLNKQKEKKSFNLGDLYKDKDDEDFVLELFRKSILKGKNYEEEIIKKTPNWESDRIADIDMILMKMAVTEFVDFPSIPVRVSINEYLEIAKDYSTQKSSYFINGVLDKVSKEFMKTKKIEKIGRGLL